MLTWEGHTAAVIRKVLPLRINIFLRWYMQCMQMLAWVVFVFVIETGSVEDVEMVKSRGTRSRMRVGEGRLPKSLLTVSFRHYSPSATCVSRNRVPSLGRSFLGLSFGVSSYVGC
jgi:hypothetical protein